MTLVGKIHGTYVHARRVHVLAEHVSARLPDSGRVLDVGCGDGRLAKAVQEMSPNVSIAGIDVFARDDAVIPVSEYDGVSIPYPDNSYDAAILVDVLHHTENPCKLLAEAIRVAKTVILKDHLADGLLAVPTLRFMDRIGNARFGVALPYNYWRRVQWIAAFEELGVSVEDWDDRIKLYQPPANLIFGRGLHFVTRLSAKN